MSEATAATPEKDKYSINGLTYTKMGLVALFAWLLWGDFCFSMMEILKPKLLPLLLQKESFGLNASSTAFMIMFGTIPGITGILIGPAVSFKSDRYRSPQGRRIPFIKWTMVPLVLALFGIGFGPFYKDWFVALDGFLGLSAAHYAILLIGFFVAMFHCMDEFVNCVYWYLFADVVPEAFIGRFAALFRLVGIGATTLFMWKIFPLAETSFHWIFFGIGVLYLFGFSLMCSRVKEGEYPPPEDIGENPGIIEQAKIYITECFKYKIYVNLFLFSIFSYMASTIALANVVIFHTDGIGLSLEQIGKVGAAIGIVTMVLAYPSGWLVDKFNAMRITLLMLFPIMAFQGASFFLMRDFNSFVALEGGRAVFLSLLGAATYPMLIVIFPKDKFGQFCSCNGAMRSVAMMLAAPLMGFILDLLTDAGRSKFDFRWGYMLGTVCYVFAFFFLYNVYREWKARGGIKAYVAPGSALEKEMLAKAAASQANAAAEDATE